MKISHIGWNLFGLSFPLVVAAVAVPHLIDRLGNEKFGLLALTWGLIGYAGALDLGVGRALTQMISRLRGENNTKKIPALLATAVVISFFASLFLSALFVSLIFFDVSKFLSIKNTSVSEINISILLLGLAIPAQAMSATYKGLNEAYLNFRGISVLRVILGLANFGAPFVVTFFSNNLAWVICTLTVSRLVALLVFRELALSCMNKDKLNRADGRFSKDLARKLFSFGGWITVSSVISPFLMQADRFFIAHIIAAAAVTVYVLPYEMVVQSLIVVGAISTVVFPNLSRMIGTNSVDVGKYFNKWLFLVSGIMTGICIVIALILPIILPLWIKGNLDDRSIVIGQILCMGVLSNSIGSMYYALIHAKGRPDLTAKLHILELPLYATLLYFLLENFGIVGAAWAWVARMLFDSMALYLANRKI